MQRLNPRATLRHTRTTRFAQLTFWDLPAPRLQE
jgi:hypothetical protein